VVFRFIFKIFAPVAVSIVRMVAVRLTMRPLTHTMRVMARPLPLVSVVRSRKSTTSIVGTSSSPTIVGVDSVKKSSRIIVTERESEEWIYLMEMTVGHSTTTSVRMVYGMTTTRIRRMMVTMLSKELGFTIEPVYS